MDHGIFNVHTNVNAYDCTRGCTDTIRESALKVDSERKIPYCIRKLNLHQRCASLILYQLRYAPAPPQFEMGYLVLSLSFFGCFLQSLQAHLVVLAMFRALA